MIGIIYYLYHIESGKGYVGKHNKPDPKGRISAHSRSKSIIGNAIRKYGLESFKTVILFSDSIENNLFNAEIYFISLLDTISPGGYNLSSGGEGISGFKQSKITNLAVSLALTGVPWSDARRKAHNHRCPRRKRLSSDQVKFINSNPHLTKLEIMTNFKVSERVARDVKSGKYPTY